MFALIAMAPPPSDELEDYIFELANGEMQAMGPLYKAASPSVYAFALSVLKNTQDAQDVLQDTFVSVYTGANTYYSNGKPMAWIMTIAKNHCYKLLKQHSKTESLNLEDWRDDPSLVTYMQSDAKLLIHHIMQSLSDQERQVVVLHAVSGFKHREIAALLNMPLPTVLSKYNRAIKKLKDQLEKEDGNHDK